MEILDGIRDRASVRAFLDKPVTRETIESVLETARWAPSGTNTQPWSVAVVVGEKKQQLAEQIVAAFQDGYESAADYQYYPKQFAEPFQNRRVTCGMALYEALGIERSDRERRREQWVKNYRGFDAPVQLYIFIDGRMEKGSWVDVGMFIQNILLAARGHDLETCAQAAFADYAPIVRQALELPEHQKLVCGIAMGYADWDDPVNSYRTEREPVEGFTSWHGQD